MDKVKIIILNYMILFFESLSPLRENGIHSLCIKMLRVYRLILLNHDLLVFDAVTHLVEMYQVSTELAVCVFMVIVFSILRCKQQIYSIC
jgi:hypothetical protein